ncbi:hypothetical protein [Streptomyces sp. NPDC102264]|uniref:hypothetical protein n=1 Tax=Streptomyces sp. NPDC102264 TaxID=3366149 RepID=UPI0038066E62
MPDHPRHTHDGKGRYIRTLTAAERDAEAARLRSRGWPYQRIADELGYADRGEAHHAVGRVLKATVQEAGDELRTLELERLDAMYASVMDVLERKHFTVSNGKIMYMGDQPLEDDGPVLQAVDRLLRIQERRARLLGLDAPAKTQVSGGVTYEIVGVDMNALR